MPAHEYHGALVGITPPIGLAGNVGDMSATSKNVANFRSDMPIPATHFSCVGTLLCRDFSDIDVPITDDISYIGKYIDLSMYDTLAKTLGSCVCVFVGQR